MLREYEAVLKAAADPNRARMLKMLEVDELCVCQIVAIIGLSQSTVSKHLSILRDAGLLEERKVGRWVYFRPAENSLNPYALPLLALVHEWLKDDKTVAEDTQRGKLIRKIAVEELCSLSEEEILACDDTSPAPQTECCGKNECDCKDSTHD